MVEVTQNDEEIKIIIELNRLVSRRPDIVLLPSYLKFNNPPIFFEGHLTKEIDEEASFCRILKNQARLILIKKEKGIWTEIFEKFSKDELMKRRREISDVIISRNKERDEKALERYELKKREEIEREVNRETEMRERVKQFQEKACDEIMISVTNDTHVKTKTQSSTHSITVQNLPSRHQIVPLRTPGKINVKFSNFAHITPKRESQEGVARPFTIENNIKDLNINIK